MFRLGNIRTQVILLLTLIILVASLVVGAFFWYEQRTDALRQKSFVLWHINYSTNDMRRLQKDFLAYAPQQPLFFETGNSIYIDSMKNICVEIYFNLDQLSQHSDTDTASRNIINKITDNLNQYMPIFDSLTTLIRQKGTTRKGLIGNIRQTVQKIEQTEASIDLNTLHIVRQYEKDFMLGLDTNDVSMWQKALQRLRLTTLNIDKTSQRQINYLLLQYQNQFLELVKIEKIIGINESLGLLSETEKIFADISRYMTEISRINADNYNKLLARFKIIFLVILCSGVLMVILFAFYLYQRLSIPVTLLSRSIRKSVESNFDKDIPIHEVSYNNEIGALSNDVSMMLQRVHERTTEVEIEKEKLRRAYDDIDLLSRIGQDIIAQLNVENILRVTHQNLNKLIAFDSFAIAIENKFKKTLDFYGILVEAGKINQGFDLLSEKDRLSVWCFDNKKEIFISDITTEYSRYVQKITLPKGDKKMRRSLIYVPLATTNRVLGIITIQANNREAFTDYHLDIMRNIAIYTSIALENAESFRQIEIQNEKILAKNSLIEQQKSELTKQAEKLQETNREMLLQKNEAERQRNIAVKHSKQITDSINYAKRIQNVILPDAETLMRHFDETFVFFRPRDIVSGDFYWVSKRMNTIIVAVADCTGHGVPGAFMSILSYSFLNEIANKHAKKFYSNAITSGELLDDLRERLKEALNQTSISAENKDGLDISLLMIDRETNRMNFAGANNPLYLIRQTYEPIQVTCAKPNIEYKTIQANNYNLLQLPADSQPIAVYKREEKFTTHFVDLQKGDVVYLFSDGYLDQIGGEKRRKFMALNFRQQILNVQHLSLRQQHQHLEQTMTQWMSDASQVDDMTVLGLKI